MYSQTTIIGSVAAPETALLLLSQNSPICFAWLYIHLYSTILFFFSFLNHRRMDSLLIFNCPSTLDPLFSFSFDTRMEIFFHISIRGLKVSDGGRKNNSKGALYKFHTLTAVVKRKINQKRKRKEFNRLLLI
jgi:hypothetical protein